MKSVSGGRKSAPSCDAADVSPDEMLDIMQECYLLGAQEALYRANQGRDTIHNISEMIRTLNWENDEWVTNLIDHIYERVRGPKGKRLSSSME